MISTFKNLFLGNNSRQDINNILIYSHFENGLLFLNDGTIVKAYEFEGSVTEQNNESYYMALNQQLQNAFSLLPVNTTIHKCDLKAAKVYKNVNENSNTLHKDISEHFAGRKGLAHKCYIFLIFGGTINDNPLLTKLSRLNLNINGAKKINKVALSDIENSCNGFRSAIDATGLKLNPVNRIENLYNVLHNCLNLKFEAKQRDNFFIEGDIVKSKDYIAIGNKLCSYVTMMSQPEKLYPVTPNENGVSVSYTAALYNLNFPYIIHTTIQRLDRDDKLAEIDKEKFFQMSAFSDNENDLRTEGSQIRFHQIRKATVKIREENLDLYNVGIAVAVFATNEEILNKRINECINAFHYLGIEPLRESFDNLNIHAALSPGNAANFYRTFCTTSNCAAVYFNTDTQKQYHKEGISFIDRKLFPINFKLIGNKTDNPHALVIGPSGTGKTFNMLHIINTRFEQGFRQIITDQKGDYKPFVESLGGKHIDYTAENPIRLNPFLIGTAITNDRLEFLTNFILNMIGSDGKNTVEYATILSRVKQYLESEKGTATLKRFYEWNNLQTFEAANFSENDFKIALELYATGVYSNLFNHTEIEDFSEIKLLSIDFTSIKDARYYKQVFLMVTEICRQIVEKYPTDNKAIYMDECWSQLDKNPAFIEFYIRVGRSLNVALHIITQGIDEILNTSIGQTIITNTDTKILLNHNGKADQIDKISNAFSFSPHHKTLFESLTTGKKPTFREIFIKQKDQAVVLGVEVPLNLVGLYTTKPAERRLFQDLLKANNGNTRKAQLDFANKIKEGALL